MYLDWKMKLIIILFISDILLKNHLMPVLRLFTDYCQGKWMKHRLMMLFAAQ